jgi:hypothetical protein
LEATRLSCDLQQGAGSFERIRAEPFAIQVNVAIVILLRGEWNKALLNVVWLFLQQNI